MLQQVVQEQVDLLELVQVLQEILRQLVHHKVILVEMEQIFNQVYMEVEVVELEHLVLQELLQVQEQVEQD